MKQIRCLCYSVKKTSNFVNICRNQKCGHTTNDVRNSFYDVGGTHPRFTGHVVLIRHYEPYFQRG